MNAKEARKIIWKWKHSKVTPTKLEIGLIEALGNMIKHFGCENMAEIDQDHWLDCKHCVTCKAKEVLSQFREAVKP